MFFLLKDVKCEISMFCYAKRAEIFLIDICTNLCTVAFLIDEYLSRSVEFLTRDKNILHVAFSLIVAE